MSEPACRLCSVACHSDAPHAAHNAPPLRARLMTAIDEAWDCNEHDHDNQRDIRKCRAHRLDRVILVTLDGTDD